MTRVARGSGYSEMEVMMLLEEHKRLAMMFKSAHPPILLNCWPFVDCTPADMFKLSSDSGRYNANMHSSHVGKSTIRDIIFGSKLTVSKGGAILIINF